MTAPVRLPWRGIKRLYRPVERRRWERRQRQEQQAEAERLREREREEERQHAEALVEVQKILDVD